MYMVGKWGLPQSDSTPVPRRRNPLIASMQRTLFKATFIERAKGSWEQQCSPEASAPCSLPAWHLVRAVLEEVVAHHGHAGQEGHVLLEIHLAVTVAVQIAHELLQAGLIGLSLPRSKRGVKMGFCIKGHIPESQHHPWDVVPSAAHLR